MTDIKLEKASKLCKEKRNKEEITDSESNSYDFILPSEFLAEEIKFEPPKKKIKAPERTTSRSCKSRTKNRVYRGMRSGEVRRILEGNVIPFCQENGLLASSAMCSCGKPMVLVRKETSTGFSWQCRKGVKGNKCKVCFTLRKGTWFENSKLSISDILWIAYMWVYEYSYNSMLHECGHSPMTLVEWLSSCQDACQAIMESKTEPIGGVGKMVELFECKCPVMEQKNNGNRWIFCALEQFSCKSVLVFVKDKKSKSLVQLFESYILPYSTVLTNLWNAFRHLKSNDFSYLKVQKSIKFYDTVTKTEIEEIDVLQEVAARSPAINHWTKYEYGSKFCELIYRKSLSYSTDAYLTFVQDISKIYPPVSKHTKSEKDKR